MCPQFSYECLDCKQPFTQRKSFESMMNVECPCCGAWGGTVNRHGKRKIERIFKAPQIMKDIDSQDGRTGDAVQMPGFDGKPWVRSRRQLTDLQKRTREAIYERTRGDHTTTIRDPKTGKEEKHTVTSEGIDPGEIHTMEGPVKTPDLHEIVKKETMAKIKKEARSR